MATEPVTLQEAKDWLRVDINDDDTLIAGLITAAREHVEDVTGRRLMDTTETAYFDAFAASLELPRAPLDSITSVVYIDTAGVTQTLATTVYDADTVPDPGLCRLAYNQSWPTVRDTLNPITITYVAGYGASDDIPQGLKTAMKLLIAHWYEHREAVADANRVATRQVPMGIERLLWQYRVMTVQK